MMTRVAENRVTPQAPEGYRREDFVPLVPLMESGRLERVFCALRKRWLALAEALELPLDALREARTRGELIRRAYDAAQRAAGGEKR